MFFNQIHAEIKKMKISIKKILLFISWNWSGETVKTISLSYEKKESLRAIVSKGTVSIKMHGDKSSLHCNNVIKGDIGIQRINWKVSWEGGDANYQSTLFTAFLNTYSSYIKDSSETDHIEDR